VSSSARLEKSSSPVLTIDRCDFGSDKRATPATFTTPSACSEYSPSPDNNYVLSGSDDGNVRLWRARASERQGVKSHALQQNLQYNEALKERYKHMPEIKRIARHRHIPKTVLKAGEIKAEELKAIKRKEENERRHTKKGETRRKAEREKMVLAREQ
jgi:WD repeat and SOF domain-containing protein 1